MEIILICLELFQEYILDNIKNLLLVGNNNITVICNKKFFNKFHNLNVKLVNSESLSDFSYSKKSKLYTSNFKIKDTMPEIVKKTLINANKKKMLKIFGICAV